jgi:ribosomal protein S15P/S13E
MGILQGLIIKRRNMMRYLMRTDIVEFAKVVQELGLMKEALQIKMK